MRTEDVLLVLSYTRRWIYYGWLTHAVSCAVIAAAKGVLGG
ncbi:MAG: hypothetical protein NW208_07225 [Bryobacter sp.]|nr:hypothetical protein [Bryobacter sp.]